MEKDSNTPPAKRLKTKPAKSFPATSRNAPSRPKLPELLNFKISSGNTVNIVQQIGTHYSTLGPLLLNDDTGAVTQAIVNQHSQNADEINKEILTRWLQGQGRKPVTWSTLIDVLKKIGLSELTQMIKKGLKSSETSSGESSVPPSAAAVESPLTTQPIQQRAALASGLLTSTPTFPEFVNFKTSSGSSINIVEKIGVHYSKLGRMLLNDETGAITKEIVYQNPLDVEAMNTEILKEWLKGQRRQPVTWCTLIDILKEIGLSDLAEMIQDNLIKAKIKEQEERNAELRQQLKMCRQKLHKTEETIRELEMQIRQNEDEKEMFLQIKMKEIDEAERKLWLMRKEAQSSRTKIDELHHQLQSGEHIVTYFEADNKQSIFSTCHVSGPGLQSATVNHETHVIVELNTNSYSSNSSVLTAELELISTSTNITPTPAVCHDNSEYKVTYTPVSRGQHKLRIRLGDVEIKSSPFTVTVYPDPYQLAYVDAVTGLDLAYGIAFNSRGEMIVTQRMVDQVLISVENPRDKRIINELGKVRMAAPKGIAIDKDDNIYVSSEHKLQKFDSRGKIIKSVGQGGSREKEFMDPRGIALYNDEVYVCDRINHRIQVFDQYLKFVRLIGTHGKGRGEFDTPKDIDFDRDGNMYVADFGNDRVQVMNTSGYFLRELDEERLFNPSGLHIVDNYVYVSDFVNGYILVYETSGKYVTTFGERGENEGQFTLPRCITSCADGFIYVCDYSNNRVQILS